MAKVNVEFDTVEKSFSVSIDGKSVDNVIDVAFFKGYSKDEWGFNLRTAMHDEEKDIHSYTVVSANEKGELTRTPQVMADIEDFLS